MNQTKVKEIIEKHSVLPVINITCIACGGCESRCPFRVPVIERMAAARALFGDSN